MKITISDRFRSFSHKAGHQVLVPGTLVALQVFPTELVWGFLGGEKRSLVLYLKGPMDPFTVEQDLDARLVRIYGQSQQGYFRMSVRRAESGELMLHFEKTPVGGILTTHAKETSCFSSGDVFPLDLMESKQILSQERLFLGLSKQKEWERIRDRQDLREILPLWHALGRTVPMEKEEKKFFPVLEEAINKREKQVVYNLLISTYLAHFSAGFFPRKEDWEKQGIAPLIDCATDLLPRGSESIRSLFFQENADVWYFLPCLLSQFASGKMTGIRTKTGCNIDFEWTKHRLRKVKVTVPQEQEIRWHFPSEVKTFRIRCSYKDRGKVLSAQSPSFIVPEGEVWLDLFQR